jgi:hypothetical protein
MSGPNHLFPYSTRSPELAGSDHQMVTGALAGNGTAVGSMYAYLWGKKVVAGSLVNVAAGGVTAGKYETDTHLVSLSVSYTF